jgi:uncharacterized protein with HEPN domain
MRRDRERMMDVLDALDSLARSLRGFTEVEFLSNELIYSASAYQLTIVGEAAAGVSAEMRERYPQIEWRKVIGLRNVLVHQYFGIDRPMVWQVAMVEAPALRSQIFDLLLAEFPE